MKLSLKGLLFAFILNFVSHADISAQIVLFQYRQVPQENIDEFLHRETTYWSQVAQKAIDAGKLSSWALWQKIGGWDLPNRPNFLFVNVFEDATALDDMGAVWGGVQDLFPGVPMSSISTDHLGTVNHQLVIAGVAGEGAAGQTQFLRINYAKADPISKYLELEQSQWQPFIKDAIESKKVKQVTWRLGQLVMPAGAGLPFNAITTDGYLKMSDAVSGGFPSDIEFPDMAELSEVHTKEYIQVYAKVKEVRKK
jgi:hypothetical protein